MNDITLTSTDISVIRRGDVDDAAVAGVCAKVAAAAAHSYGPVLHAEVRLRMAANPATERPAIVEATLDVDGRPIRAHVSAGTMREAADLLEARLRRQLAAGHDRRVRGRRVARTGLARTELPPTREQAQVRRRATYAPAPESVDDAFDELTLLDHRFYLFVDVESGEDTVVAFDAAGEPVVERLGDPAPELDVAGAVEWLVLDAGADWVFFRDRATQRGTVLYRRADGDLGLVEPARRHAAGSAVVGAVSSRVSPRPMETAMSDALTPEPSEAADAAGASPAFDDAASSWKGVAEAWSSLFDDIADLGMRFAGNVARGVKSRADAGEAFAAADDDDMLDAVRGAVARGVDATRAAIDDLSYELHEEGRAGLLARQAESALQTSLFEVGNLFSSLAESLGERRADAQGAVADEAANVEDEA